MAQDGLKNLDQGLLELEALVKELETGNLSIDDAIEKYSQGMKLAVACRRSLNDMSQKVAIIRQQAMQEMNELAQAEGALPAEAPSLATPQVAAPQVTASVAPAGATAAPSLGRGQPHAADDIPF